MRRKRRSESQACFQDGKEEEGKSGTQEEGCEAQKREREVKEETKIEKVEKEK